MEWNGNVMLFIPFSPLFRGQGGCF
jgi:hypothetical protein